MAPRYIAVIATILLISAAVAGYVSYSVPSGGGNTPSGSTASSHSVVTFSGSPTTSTTCESVAPASGQKLNETSFLGMTEFSLPAPLRSPNAITAAPDGSVWFGEQAVPGVAHLYPNGTLREYPWTISFPTNVGSCGEVTDIWGVAVWNGTVWGTDAFGSRLVSVQPTTNAIHAIQLKNSSFPYTLTVAPDNKSLWFTLLSSPGEIGRINTNSTTPDLFYLPNGTQSSSAYVLFANETLGYVLSISPDTGTTQMYSFNPSSQNLTFTAVGNETALNEPISMALGKGGIWVTEHSASEMAFLNFTTSKWVIYPLSNVPFIATDLSYFDVSNGTTVWFNEHYANRLGQLSDNGSQLTEYSFTDPAMTNFTKIALSDNFLTVALGHNRVWFTGWTANVIGFYNTTYVPPYSVSIFGHNSVQVAPGGSVKVEISISGQATGLSMNYSDTEQPTSIPRNLTFSSTGFSPNLKGQQNVTVTVGAAESMKPGTYLAAITVADQGMIYRSVYVEILVS